MNIITQKFDYAQYLADAEVSKVNPLPRRFIQGFEQVGIKIECFALPGLETNPKRYVLSQTGCSTAIKKSELTIRQFLDTKGFKALYNGGFESVTFSVENSNRPVSGIPGWVAIEYWLSQSFKGNKEAQSIIRVLAQTQLDNLVGDSYEIIRTPQQRIENFKNTWEIIRTNTRHGYKTLESFIWNYYADEFFTRYPHGMIRQQADFYINSRTKSFLTNICCEIVRSLTGQRPLDIYNELKLAGEDPNKEELRDWYSQELLEAIEGVQDKLIKMFQQNPKMIASFDAESVIPGLASEYGVIDWHPSV